MTVRKILMIADANPGDNSNFIMMGTINEDNSTITHGLMAYTMYCIKRSFKGGNVI